MFDSSSYSFNFQRSGLSVIRYLISIKYGVFMIIILLWNSASFAQNPVLHKGDRIKVYAPTLNQKELIGTLVDYSPDVLILERRNQRVPIANDLISELAVSNGKKSNVLPFAASGALAGGLVLGLISATSVNTSEDNFFDISEGGAFGIGALAGVLIGGVVGNFIGLLSSSDRWEKIPLTELNNGGINHATIYRKYPVVTFKISLNHSQK